MLSIKGEFREKRPRDRHILLKGVKCISACISHTSWTIWLKFDIDNLHVIIRVIMNCMLIDTVTAIFYSVT